MARDISPVRPARVQDSDVLALIYATTWRATWQGIFPHTYIESMVSRRNALWWAKNLKRATTPPPLLFVHEDKAVGYINFGNSRYGDSGFEGEIYELNILPDYQGVGFGGQLFDAARKQLERSGRLGLIAWSLQVNERCCLFYQAKGGTAFTNSVVRFGNMGILKEYDRIGYSWPAY